MPDPLDPLRPLLDNVVPPIAVPYAAGVLGDHPSAYSRSPAMWNAAFAALGLPAAYVAFDVAPQNLQRFLAACRDLPGLLGLSVTVPHKERVLSLLDEVSGEAAVVGAVNLIARGPAVGGRLVGSNTDVTGALPTLRRLCAGLPGSRPQAAVILGAGGAARAVGAALRAAFPEVLLWIAARSSERAQRIAKALMAETATLEALETMLPKVDLIVNATPVGMAGPSHGEGEVLWLEVFSSLAPVDPLPFDEDGAGDRSPNSGSGATTRSGPSHSSVARPAGALSPAPPPRAWVEQAWPSIATNLERSLRRALLLPPRAVVLDLVYAPPETVLMKHARWTGHAAANGLEVLVGQAVAGITRLCASLLQGRDPGEVESRAAEAMRQAVA